MKHIRQNIIDELTANPGRSLTDIARVVDLPVPEVHSILQQMIQVGNIIANHPTRYYINPIKKG